MTHRNTKIQDALDTLVQIERAVLADLKPTSEILSKLSADQRAQFILSRIDNAVRLYCADDIGQSLSRTEST